MRLKVSEIKIPERFRIEYGDIPDLSKSLREKGQLQTILVHKEPDGSWELIAGARRLLAFIQAKIEEVEVLTREGLTPLEKRELEVEENIKRKDFTFVEEVRWKEELKEIYERKNPPGIFSTGSRSGAITAIAEKLGESDSNVDRDLELAEGLRDFPELTKEKNKSSAYKKLKQLKSQVLLEVLAERKKDSIPDLTIIHGPAEEKLEEIKDESVNLIITDPPWGVDQDHSESVSESLEKFEDGVDYAFSTMRKVVPHLFRVATNNSHMYVFFATKYYTEVGGLLTQSGWIVEPIPLVWYKRAANNIFPHQKFSPTYETIFFCTKGKRFLNRPSSAVFEYPPPEDKVHPTQKPLSLIREFVEISSIAGEVVLDCFAGSGVVGNAGVGLKRKVILIEKDQIFFNKIKLMEVQNE